MYAHFFVISIGVGEFYSFLFPFLSPPGSVDWLCRLTKGKVILFWAAVGVFCVNKSYNSKAIGSTIRNKMPFLWVVKPAEVGWFMALHDDDMMICILNIFI